MIGEARLDRRGGDRAAAHARGAGILIGQPILGDARQIPLDLEPDVAVHALIGKPRLILADEPTGALDSETSRQIMDLMTEINQTGITVLVVTHDPEVASRTQRTIRLRDGKVIGASEAGVSNPGMPAARDSIPPPAGT